MNYDQFFAAKLDLLKQEGRYRVFADIERRAKPEAVLATNPSSLRLEDMLPKLAAPSATDVDPDVLRLLKEGRKKESAFDLRHSPLAAYLYARLGDAASDRALASEDGWPFLEALPRDQVLEVATLCQQIATTRASGLAEIVARLKA